MNADAEVGKHGPLAVVTGASPGIGYELAHVLRGGGDAGSVWGLSPHLELISRSKLRHIRPLGRVTTLRTDATRFYSSKK